jgi:hypothetical protein
LWRLARHTHRGSAKAAWITAGTRLGIAPDGVFRIGRRREQVAANYVLFSASPEETVTLCDPPAIASATAPGQLETWTSDPFAAEIAKLRLFGGMTIDDAGKLLGVSRATAFRSWTYARAWLNAHLQGTEKP